MAIRTPVTVIHSLMEQHLQGKDILFIHIWAMAIRCLVLKENQSWWLIPDEIDEFTGLLWESLNEENKVSLFVRYINIARRYLRDKNCK